MLRVTSRIALGLALASAVAQELPQTVRQGDTIRISAAPSAVKARMGSRTVQLFHHDGKSIGLMPVEVNQNPGAQELLILDAAGRAIDRRTITVEHVAFPTQNIVISRAKKQIKPSPGEMETVGALRNTVTLERFWAEPFAPRSERDLDVRFQPVRSVDERRARRPPMDRPRRSEPVRLVDMNDVIVLAP